MVKTVDNSSVRRSRVQKTVYILKLTFSNRGSVSANNIII